MSEQIIALIGGVLVAALPIVRSWVKTYLTPARLARVMEIAQLAVRAAEKLGNDLGEWTPGDTNAQKLDFAASVVAKGARRLGVRLSKKEVLAFVHTALDEMERVRADA